MAASMAMEELCDVCDGLDLGATQYKDDHLGAYDEMVRKARSIGPGQGGCGGCAFFCDVLRGSERWKGRVAELEGQIVDIHSMRLDVKKPEKAKQTRFMVDDLMLDRCVIEGEPDQEAQIDCKRPVMADPKDASCFEEIKSWLAKCAKHDDCAGQEAMRLPKRIIEVPADDSETPRLRVMDGEQLGKYLILSHRWSSQETFKLTDALLASFQDAIPLEKLPRSFQDAVDITRRLGFQYVWIDALCIIQDNATDWQEEARNLASYYSRSTLMIAANTAEDSSQGILNQRHVPYSPVLGKDKKYCLRQKLLRWHWDLEHSVLSSRGWAAQERMLAPRIVHYTQRQMMWECANGIEFEASNIKDLKTGSGQFHRLFSKKKFQPYVTRSLTAAESSSSDSSYDIHQDTMSRTFTWHQCLDEYTERSLSDPSDKIPALSGVASIINQDGRMGQYLAGIWSNFLAAGLAWGRQYALFTSPPTYRAPSWSWASVDGTSKSLILASSVELLEPPKTELGRKWAEKFELKLVEEHIVLRDTEDVYGEVMEGSHIIVDATCIPKDDLIAFAVDMSGYAAMAFDYSNAGDCPCCSRGVTEDGELVEDGEQMQNEAHFDMGVILTADAWRVPDGFVDILLLAWVNEKEQTMKRVGILRLTADTDEEEIETFSDVFLGLAWQKLRLKLV